jgi:hypothetical protein
LADPLSSRCRYFLDVRQTIYQKETAHDELACA